MRLNFNWSRVALLSVPYTGMSLLYGMRNGFDIITLLISILVLAISLSFHEMAHAWSAYKLGDDTAAVQGRLTMNPLAHLDPIGSLMFLLAGIGWARPVPINPARFSRSKTIKQGIMLTSLAGPMSNLVLAAVSLIVLYLFLTIASIAQIEVGAFTDVVMQLGQYMFYANITLAVFNLLPVPPLDGFKIFGSMLPDRLYYRIMGYERYIGMAFLLLVLFGRGILGTVLGLIRIPFEYVILNPIAGFFGWLWGILGLV
jgi:Zn-dependent protease